MARPLLWLSLPAALLAALLRLPGAPAGEVGFIEAFALAPDRAAPLGQLVPGSEDYYYYHALHHLHAEQFDKAEELTRPWHARFGQTPRLTEIQTRHALLTYDRDPRRALEYLRRRLGLRFDHQKETTAADPALPTALDPARLDPARLTREGLEHRDGLDAFEDAALDRLATAQLTRRQLAALLRRLTRPDLPNLPQLLAADFAAPDAPAFGAYPVHAMLTLAQIEQLVRLRPTLMNHPVLVKAWAGKLAPGADSDWRRDKAEARAYLGRLQALANRLAPAHMELKAHAYYHRLALDRSEGVYDKGQFLAYLATPRRQPYLAREFLESAAFRAGRASGEEPSAYTPLPPVGADEELVRDFLKHFLRDADSPREFAPFVDGVYLNRLFAEAKIEAGLGDPEAWASQLPPEQFRQFRERVDIDFAPTNAADYPAGGAVRLDLFTKNVPSLIVKVFEINARNYYRTNGKEVNTDVNLDGLVPTAERTLTFADSPLRRVARQFDFPELAGPGVYVVDFIGGGKSSRALVRKGKLRPLARPGAAGVSVTVVDESNKPVPDALLWLAGQEYAAGKDGVITVPYSTSPGRRPVVLSRGDFASLDHLEHLGERYSLAAGIHVDRESLLTRRVAPILVRPGLLLGGRPASVKLLEDVRLRVVSTDRSGVSSSVEVPDFKLFEDRESVHEVRVPDRLASLAVTLTARVKTLTTALPMELSAAASFAVNAVDATDKVEDLHLARFGGDWVIELLGRSGEPRLNRPVNVALKLREFRDQVYATLKTDAAGRVKLGALDGVDSVSVTGPEGTSHNWPLPRDAHSYRRLIHAKAGEAVRLPYLGSAAAPTRGEFALFEVRGDDVRADRFEAISLKDGSLELTGLEPGDYELHLKREGRQVRVRVVAGAEAAGYLLGRARDLEAARLKPLHVASAVAEGDSLVVRLRDWSPAARVHVFAARYRPAHSAFGALASVRGPEPAGVVPSRAPSLYLTGRNIGDEYRYVLDRRAARRFPGSMLERPSFLLNPWAVRDTDTAEQQARLGDDFTPGAVPAPASPAMPPSDSALALGQAAQDPAAFPNYDFLADPAAVRPNLVPDDAGVVRVPLADLGPHALVTVVAADPLNVTSRTVSLPEKPAAFADRRLRDGLDAAGHFAQQKRVSVLEANKPLTLADAAAGRFEVYDSVGRAYGLYATLVSDPRFAEFAFLPSWPKKSPEEKRALYSKFACHELHLFLAKKDPAFFNGVVKPYLANKKYKTFVDDYLLGDDLSAYLKPWEYGRLNAAERVLLAARVAGEPAKTARHLEELLRLAPPEAEKLAILFDTAVQNGELGGDRFGLMERKLDEMKRAEMPALNRPAPAAEPAAAAPPAPAGPVGGMMPKPADAAGRPRMKMRDGRSEEQAKDAKKQMRGVELDVGAVTEFYAREEEMRKSVRTLYRRVEPTKEWAENNYYRTLIQQQVAGLIPPGRFWLDYARHSGNGPFMSEHLAGAARNFPEAMLALALLDLPFDAGKPETKFDGPAMTYTPAGPAVAFHEEIRPVAAAQGPASVLLSQNFYRHGDRYRDENGERLDNFVSGEFVAGVPYGMHVVVTNPSSARQKLTLLLQLPVGAVPLSGAKFTQSSPLDLEPYRTQAVDVLFYFPKAGRFAHFPAHVGKGDRLAASAPPVALTVVDTPSKPDTQSWNYVSQNGTDAEVLALLARENAAALDLDKMAFRLKERGFYEAATKLLAERHVYHGTTWSYSLMHADAANARQFLLHSEQILGEAGGPIESPVLVYDPVAHHHYEHLEYKPLANARAHALGEKRQIVNDRLHEQYHKFLKVLSYRRGLADADHLAAAYYLLLQDRVEEALAAFTKVNPAKLPTRLQYDYCDAYLKLFVEDRAAARAVAEKYAAHPVDRWRNAFAEIARHLDEAEGKSPPGGDAADAARRQAALAASEPGFELDAKGDRATLAWRNLAEVRVNYYLMDVELLFSRNPFARQDGGQFASVKPNATRDLKLPQASGSMAVPLPEEFARRNVLVEVVAAGKSKSAPLYAGAMDVQVTEAYGQVRVAEGAGGKPLPKVYVKVYAKGADGSVRFHKDGYTDLRGRFDYATVSGPQRAAERYALLVLSDERGAAIREASPPAE